MTDHGLPTQCLDHNRWDREKRDRMVAEVPAFLRARQRLGVSVTTGVEVADDAFWALLKAVPTLLAASEVRATHLVNRTVLIEFSALAATKRLRLATVGNAVAAALAVTELRPALEAIFDQLEAGQRMAARLDRLLQLQQESQEKLEAMEAAVDALDADDLEGIATAVDDLRDARSLVDLTQRGVESLTQDLQDRLDQESGLIRGELHEAVDRLSARMIGEQAVFAAWGLAPGQLRRLSAGERLELARQLNTDRMRSIAELFGRIHNLALSEAAEHITTTPEEIYDLELGDNLAQVMPAEFLLLGEESENAFFARYAERELLQYAMEGTEELGRGGIIMCVDGSGSMGIGQRELWAKAVMLVLLHLAREQRRTMHVIHFGGPGQVRHIGFTGPADFTPERIIDAASVAFMGGTSFESPMLLALELLQTEFDATGFTCADVVFATDDECQVPAVFMEHYLSEMKRMGARTWGVALTRLRPGALDTMSEGRVATVEDLTSGRDIRELLRGTR